MADRPTGWHRICRRALTSRPAECCPQDSTFLRCQVIAPVGRSKDTVTLRKLEDRVSLQRGRHSPPNGVIAAILQGRVDGWRMGPALALTQARQGPAAAVIAIQDPAAAVSRPWPTRSAPGSVPWSRSATERPRPRSRRRRRRRRGRPGAGRRPTGQRVLVREAWRSGMSWRRLEAVGGALVPAA